jgi:hypothetical protein
MDEVECTTSAALAAHVNTGNSFNDLAAFFARKVDKIRASTSGAPSATVELRDTSYFHQFHIVTPRETFDLLTVLPAKCCHLGPIPSWLLKQLKDVLAPVSCLICNACLQAVVLAITSICYRSTEAAKANAGCCESQFVPANIQP